MTSPLQPDDRRFAQLRKLTGISRALTYAMSLQEVLDLSVTCAAELLETNKVVLMLTNSEGLLAVRAAHGLDPNTTDGFKEPLDETLIKRLQGLLGTDAERFLGVPLVVSGEVTGILAVTIDRLDDRADEREWLLSALADQTAVALEKTRLDEAASFREKVIGIVSHDLRNPIGTIQLGANVLLRHKDLSPHAVKVLTTIEANAERAGRMIRDLLDYTQAHLGSKIPVLRKPAELQTVFQQVVSELRSRHPDRRLDASDDGSALGDWDTDRLAQVVENLVSNALTYSPPDSTVRVELSTEEHWVNLTVHNGGAPISTDRLPHIFEPMQRAALPSTGSRSVGLGLYIVKHLVEAHGGSVSVRSTAPEGTTFAVRLPKHAT